MPFTYRDRPKLSDRLRGKSGEEILNELQCDLDKERRMFFDSPWRARHNNSGFPRVSRNDKIVE
ncbi:UNVERIFIED_CONTAM: hypothetical protein PYX00_000573 [Menopon gallinae]|uniref:Uncharacterized protein n=1 Tax=Menopon gallinae TaxID=328185 RepID=A0AAW2I948_9NEOP